jgi:tripartite-type tricarboxylate transporter receptor subunit TctC
MLGSTPYLLVVHPSVPARSVAQLVTHAKAKPGKLTFGSSGIGAGNHLAGEMFKHMTAIDIVHVPYKGAGPAMLDVVGGQISFMFSGVSVLKPYVDAARLRALAISTIKRSASVPDIPTMDESGVKGFQTKSWNSLVVPRRTPAAIVERLNQEINAVLGTPQLADQLKQMGIEPEPGTPAELTSYIRDEIARFKNLIDAIGLKLE